MISLALLAVVLVLVLLLVVSGTGRHPGEGTTVEAGGRAEADVPDLRRWVEAGLLTDDQANAVRAFEAERSDARPRPRLSVAVEAFSYVGGVLLSVGAGMLVARFWDELLVGGRLGILAAAALVTGVVGLVVGEADPVTWRLRGFLWALSAAGVAAFGGLFVFGVLDVTGEPVALAAAGCGALASAGYWALANRPLQHLMAFGGLAVSLGVAVVWAWGPGVLLGTALWVLGAVWAVAARRHLLRPGLEGVVLGAMLTLVACASMADQVELLAPLLGLATAGGWVALGVLRLGPSALAPGVAGVFVFLPWALGQVLGDTLGAPAIAMVSGALLLGAVLYLVRRDQGGRHAGGGSGSPGRRIGRGPAISSGS